MATLSTDLKVWGSTGAEYPNNYAYLEGEQPVDAWDNYFNSTVISDIQTLIDRINAIDSDGDKVVDAADGASDYLDGGSSKVTHPTEVNFLDKLQVTDNGDGTVSIDTSALDQTEVEALISSVSNNGTLVLDHPDDIDFGTNFDVTDDGDGSVSVSVGAGVDTRANVSDDGVEVVANVEDINFSSNVSVTDDGDGTVSIDAPTSTQSSSTSLSNVATNSVSGQGDGTYTISINATASYIKISKSGEDNDASPSKLTADVGGITVTSPLNSEIVVPQGYVDSVTVTMSDDSTTAEDYTLTADAYVGAVDSHSHNI